MFTAIIGNSQAGGAGAVLETLLKKSGKSVKRTFKNGSGNDDLVRQIDSLGKDYDEIWVFGGDDSTAGIDAFMWHVGNRTPVKWWGSSPATEIDSLSTARKVFGSKVSDKDYWFTSGEAEKRENRNRNLKKYLSKFSNVTPMDYRSFDVNGSIVQKTGVSWPNQPDGIHISDSTAKSLFSAGLAKPERSSWFGIAIAVLIGGVFAYARRKK